jgi:predicted dehydrogenase
MLRIGLAGLGHGRTLLQANSPENQGLPLRVTAICDAADDLLAVVSQEHGVEEATTEFNELVDRDDVDIIAIYTPGPLHAQQILTALEAGKHVMVTKSMVYTIEEAERVVEAVDRTGRVLLVTQSLRGRPDFMEAKRVCDAGEIGELFMAESHYVHDLRPVYARSPWRFTMPQDLVLGGACHPIDLLRWFMGDIEEVHCYGLRSGVAPEYPQEDNFVINVRFKSGKIGRIANFLGLVEPPGMPMNTLALYGTKGTIVDGSKRVDPEDPTSGKADAVEFQNSRPRGHGQEMLVMMQHMADCVLDGATPWVGAREGARVVSTGLACWESLRTGLPVKVRNEF